jgi:antitoxin VapB
MPIPDPAPIHVHLFRSKSQQAVEIPLGFELPGDEAIISRDGDRLIIEPVRRKGIAALLVSWGPLDEVFADIEADPPDEQPSPTR